MDMGGGGWSQHASVPPSLRHKLGQDWVHQTCLHPVHRISRRHPPVASVFVLWQLLKGDIFKLICVHLMVKNVCCLTYLHCNYFCMILKIG